LPTEINQLANFVYFWKRVKYARPLQLYFRMYFPISAYSLLLTHPPTCAVWISTGFRLGRTTVLR